MFKSGESASHLKWLAKGNGIWQASAAAWFLSLAEDTKQISFNAIYILCLSAFILSFFPFFSAYLDSRS